MRLPFKQDSSPICRVASVPYGLLPVLLHSFTILAGSLWQLSTGSGAGKDTPATTERSPLLAFGCLQFLDFPAEGDTTQLPRPSKGSSRGRGRRNLKCLSKRCYLPPDKDPLSWTGILPGRPPLNTVSVSPLNFPLERDPP